MSHREQVYHLRYTIENWDKPIPDETETQETDVEGIILSKGNAGYADDLFVVSLIRDTETGKIDSVLLMDTITGTNPSVEMLEMIKERIEHHLKHHSKRRRT